MTTPKLTSRRLALLSGFALLGVVGVVSVCSAESPWRRRVPSPPPSPYRVSLEAPGGGELPTFRQAGQTYILGESGERYNVRVTNPTGERVEVVVTVDGRDAITGKVGDYVGQRGYLIEPWGSLVIEGFRRSLDEVAAFRFTERGRSYSALRGTPENVGVVGVAVFPEKTRPPRVWRRSRPYLQEDDRYSYDEGRAAESSAPQSHASRGGDGAPAPRKSSGSGAGRPPPAAAEPPRAESSRSAPRDLQQFRGDEEAPRQRKSKGPSNIGTQYGEREDSSVVEVAFERRSKTQPSAVLTLRYDDYEGLQARGIDLSSLGYAYYEGEPRPFPYSRFAPPPGY